MKRDESRPFRKSWVLLGLSAGLIAGASGVLAGPSLTELIDSDMVKIRSHIKNAEMRYRNEIAGLDPGPGEPTPGRICCAKNISRIMEAVEGLELTLTELGACYEEVGNSGPQARVGFVLLDVERVEVAAAVFGAAPKDRETSGALAAMARAYIQLDGGVAALEPCPPADDQAQEALKKQKKKSRKKKRKDPS